MHMADNISPVLPIKYLMNEDGDPAMSFKLATGKKTSIMHIRVLFCPCVVQKMLHMLGKGC